MSREENYTAAIKVYALYGSFFGQVVREIGLERALDLHARASQQQGQLAGEQLSAKLGKVDDIEKLGEVLKSSNLSIGIECRLSEADSAHAIFSNAQCPMYDGYRAGGLDDQVAEALCQVGASAKLGTMLKFLDPDLSYRLTVYREHPGDVCEEEIFYTKRSET